MGRTITPMYKLETKHMGMLSTASAWSVKNDGRPTPANLAKWAASFNASLLPGGSNEHLPKHFGNVEACKVVWLRVSYNVGPHGGTVATWQDPDYPNYLPQNLQPRALAESFG